MKYVYKKLKNTKLGRSKERLISHISEQVADLDCARKFASVGILQLGIAYASRMEIMGESVAIWMRAYL